MLHGTREKFIYGECEFCGTLTLLDPPDDDAQYYSGGYYSFVESTDFARPTLLRLAKTATVVRSPLMLNDLLRRSRSPRQFPDWHPWGRRVGIRRFTSILDVGTGSGKLLHRLASDGFNNLTGVDPFMAESKVAINGVRLVKGRLEDITGSFDLVMFHHSLEHVEDPLVSLRSAERLLNPRGIVLVRIPVADSWAYRNYGVDWFQIDAPRHRYVMTTTSIAMVAARAGLNMVESFRDSTSAQFWISECYRRDISRSEISESPFSYEEMTSWKQQARRLNKHLDGDQAVFIFRRT